jgi:hypothetical protein
MIVTPPEYEVVREVILLAVVEASDSVQKISEKLVTVWGYPGMFGLAVVV